MGAEPLVKIKATTNVMGLPADLTNDVYGTRIKYKTAPLKGTYSTALWSLEYEWASVPPDDI